MDDKKKKELEAVRMLGLKLPTDPRWVNLAEKSLQEVLSDHAYCEQKVTSSCISLVQGYPEFSDVVEAIMPIVSEEWQHFRIVVKELNKRGLELGRQRKDLYVNELLKFQKGGGSRTDRLVERLLTLAMIEARSCERFRLLSMNLEDEPLRNFYHKFMVAEAGHYKLFIELAKKHGGEKYVKKRWDEFLSFEAEIMKKLELRGDRVH